MNNFRAARNSRRCPLACLPAAVLLLCWWAGSAIGAGPSAGTGFDPGEAQLYPGGFPTADTLPKSGWLFSPFGWFSYGVTDRVTVLGDWLALAGGVPAGYVRYQYPVSSPWMQTATEAYGFVLTRDLPDMVPQIQTLIVEQKGCQGWLHQNFTFQMSESWRLHAVAGVTFDSYTRYAPEGGHDFPEKIYRNRFSPDAGLALEYSAAAWLKIHANFQYGNTLYYLDQVPEKWLTVLSIHLAPFPRDWPAWLSRSRIEIVGFFAQVTDTHVAYACPPFFPLLMWQWGGEK